MREMKSIRKMVESGYTDLSEREMRRRLAQNKLPGIWVGDIRKRFLVDVEAFSELLKAEGMKSVQA